MVSSEDSGYISLLNESNLDVENIFIDGQLLNTDHVIELPGTDKRYFTNAREQVLQTQISDNISDLATIFEDIEALEDEDISLQQQITTNDSDINTNVNDIISNGVLINTNTSNITNLFSTKTTTDLAEGVNLYYTDARFDLRLAGKNTSNLLEGTNLYFTDARATTNFNTNFGLATTTLLSEGTNLYYTDARFDSRFDIRLATKSTSNLSEGSNLYFTEGRGNANFNSNLSLATTSSLSEGANLYFTNTRFDSRFDSRLAFKSTSDIQEGSNLYYTDARFDSRLSSKDSDDITEGTLNRYFTTARETAIQSELTSNDFDILTLQGTTSSNTTSISANNTKIYNLEQEDISLDARITTNINNISTNLTSINNNATNISNNLTSINNNTTDISTNSSKIYNLEQEDISQLALINARLPLAGGIMTGNIDMGVSLLNKIINCKDPLNDQDVCTKKYIHDNFHPVGTLNSDNITEGVTNLYYTTARALLKADLSYVDAQDLIIESSITNNSNLINTNSANITSNDADIIANTGLINTNITNITSNDVDIAANTGLINTNITNITSNVVDIAANTGLINSNITNITSNDVDIAANTGLINTNITNITSNNVDIAANTGLINTNITNITSNDVDIAANTGLINTNITNITSNDVDIAANTGLINTNITNITSNDVDIAANTGLINTNITNITSNDVDIAANTGLINTNITNITSNDVYIAANTGLINTNITNITSNDVDIAANTGLINTNITNITSNDVDIAANTGLINTNITNITSNDVDIAANTGLINTNITNISTKLNLSGDTMTGDINMGGNDINNIDRLFLVNGTDNRKIILYGTGDNDHQFSGFGINGSILRYQTGNTTTDHVFYAGTSTTTSDELIRIEGTGNINMNNNSITNVSEFTSNDNITKFKNNGTIIFDIRTGTQMVMQQQLNCNGKALIQPLDPTSGLHVGDRDYNDGRYLRSTGGILRGNLTLDIGVDIIGTNTLEIRTDSGPILLNAGSTGTGQNIVLRPNGSGNNEGALCLCPSASLITFYNDDTNAGMEYSTSSGILDMDLKKITNVALCTNDNDAARKKYVDDEIDTINNTLSLPAVRGVVEADKIVVVDANKDIDFGTGDIKCTNITGTVQTASQPNITSIGSLSGNLDMNENSIINIYSIQAYDQAGVDEISILSQIDMNDLKITNLGSCTYASDAVSKECMEAVTDLLIPNSKLPTVDGVINNSEICTTNATGNIVINGDLTCDTLTSIADIECDGDIVLTTDNKVITSDHATQPYKIGSNNGKQLIVSSDTGWISLCPNGFTSYNSSIILKGNSHITDFISSTGNIFMSIDHTNGSEEYDFMDTIIDISTAGTRRTSKIIGGASSTEIIKKTILKGVIVANGPDFLTITAAQHGLGSGVISITGYIILSGAKIFLGSQTTNAECWASQASNDDIYLVYGDSFLNEADFKLIIEYT